MERVAVTARPTKCGIFRAPGAGSSVGDAYDLHRCTGKVLALSTNFFVMLKQEVSLCHIYSVFKHETFAVLYIIGQNRKSLIFLDRFDLFNF